MRLGYAALFVLLFSISLTGQEEPLPAVTPRLAAEPEVMLIALASEPIREYRTPTLAEAARNNDYVSFDALYREARERGENVGAFATLHELWTYNMTSPIGAFYDAAMYERLARAYPGLANFIEDFAVVDSNGNTFYPTAETRDFVLARAIDGESPRVLIAEDVPAPRPAPVRETRSDDGLRARRSTGTTEATGTTKAARAVPSASPSVPAVPSVPSGVPGSQPGTAPAPVPAPAPVATPAQAAPVAVAEAKPVQQQQQQQPLVDASATSRGILLIVIGLLGVGLLAVIFRTPKESVPPSITTVDAKAVTPAPEAEQKPGAPVEPIRQRRENRASGSRG